MKKTVLEMVFLSDPNFPKTTYVSQFVYRHCSNLPAFKVHKLAKKLNVDLSALFVGALSYLLSGYIQQSEIVLMNKTGEDEILFWKSQVNKRSFTQTLKNTITIKPLKKVEAVFEEWALRFEVKLIKLKLLFAFYYPEDFCSDKISTQIVYDYEKFLRKLFKKFNL